MPEYVAGTSRKLMYPTLIYIMIMVTIAACATWVYARATWVCAGSLRYLLPLWRTPPLRRTGWSVGANGAAEPKTLFPNRYFLPNPPFYSFSCGTTFCCLGRTIPLTSSKFYFTIQEIVLLMSEQCTNPGPSFPCQSATALIFKAKVHQKC